MLPPFDETGWLPPGIHVATLDEVEARFGSGSEIRSAQIQSVRWMIEMAQKIGARRIVLNGSFVTDIIEPNDVDCVILLATERKRDRAALAELRSGLPFLDLKLVGERDFRDFVDRIFGTDRFGRPKGVVEVRL